MLYEYNKKFYVKPFSNKIVEVKVEKINNEFDVQPTNKEVYLTPEIQKEMIQVTIEEAFEKSAKISKNSIDKNI